MKLFLYKFEMVYLPEKCMYNVDLLSRNYNKNNFVKDERMKDKIYTINIGAITLSEDKLKQYKQNTLKDETLKLVVEYYKNRQPRYVKKSEKTLSYFIIVKLKMKWKEINCTEKNFGEKYQIYFMEHI